MRVNRTAKGAALAAGLAFLASSPEAPAAAEKMPLPPAVCRTANHNANNRLLRRTVRQIGSQVLNFKREWVKDPDSEVSFASSINDSGQSAKSVTIDTDSSLVPGSNGKYTLEVSAVDIGNNGKLDISDVNRLKVDEGSAKDKHPLFALTFHHLQKPWTDGPADTNCWYDADGTAIKPSGDRVTFDSTTDPRYTNQPGLFLDRPETMAAVHTMRVIINDALNGQPTHLVEPPFGPAQPVG